MIGGNIIKSLFSLKKMGLFTILISIGFILVFLSNIIFTKGNVVIVSVNGKEINRFSLLQNTTYKIDEYGHNTLIIENNAAWIESANCPDKLCINHGKISKSGECIICLPNKLVIKITNDNEVNTLDGIAK